MRVLVVEDEKRLAESIKKGLEHSGYAVDVALDGEAGLALALAEPYAVIVLDWMLPRLSGPEISTELRAQNIHTPILFLTAKSELSDVLQGFKSGADDYLRKPFALSELIARLQALNRRPNTVVLPQLTLDSLTLDTDARRVQRAGKTLKLSPTEYALLEFLSRHQNQLLQKETLTLHVWPGDADILPNTAQVYWSYLRRKIDVSFPQEKPLFHTIRGFGYKFGIEP